MYPIPDYTDPIPYLDTNQMIEVDRLMIEDYRIELIQMMENAGRCLAILAKERFLSSDLRGKRVVVLAGSGGNGGGAMVCARRLFNWGADIRVYTTRKKDALKAVPAHQFNILKNMSLPVFEEQIPEEALEADLIIDGIIGYSLQGNPRGYSAKFISWANRKNTPILSLDTPSGLDLTSGTIFQPVIRANATLTLALPKKGLVANSIEEIRGELYLGDISVPPALYRSASLQLEVGPIFEKSDILKIQ